MAFPISVIKQHIDVGTGGRNLIPAHIKGYSSHRTRRHSPPAPRISANNTWGGFIPEDVEFAGNEFKQQAFLK